MKPIAIVEFPFHPGLKALNGREPGVNHLPDWLRSFGLHDASSPAEVYHLKGPAYVMEADPVDKVLNTRQVS